jgi:hypothetical protein
MRKFSYRIYIYINENENNAQQKKTCAMRIAFCETHKRVYVCEEEEIYIFQCVYESLALSPFSHISFKKILKIALQFQMRKKNIFI